MSGPIAPCKFCGVTAELQLSHIVPKWAFRRVVKTGDGPNPVTIDGTSSQLRPDQFAERMLCSPCEQKFGKWDDYASMVSAQVDGTFPARDAAKVPAAPIDGRLVDLRSLDHDCLGKFAASVFWRASRSTRLAKVRLGDRYDEAIQSYLLKSKLAVPDNVVLLLQLLAGEKPEMRRIVTMPCSKRMDGFHHHQFTVFGLRFDLLVGGQVPDNIAPACFARTGTALLSSGQGVVAQVMDLIASSPARGSLAKRLSR